MSGSQYDPSLFSSAASETTYVTGSRRHAPPWGISPLELVEWTRALMMAIQPAIQPLVPWHETDDDNGIYCLELLWPTSTVPFRLACTASAGKAGAILYRGEKSAMETRGIPCDDLLAVWRLKREEAERDTLQDERIETTLLSVASFFRLVVASPSPAQSSGLPDVCEDIIRVTQDILRADCVRS